MCLICNTPGRREKHAFAVRLDFRATNIRSMRLARHHVVLITGNVKWKRRAAIGNILRLDLPP
jgi:hypothetical protein